MKFETTKGRIHSAIKTVICGSEGIGKSTLASKFPRPVFIDTEGSTKFLDVERLPTPSSWSILTETVTDYYNYIDDFKKFYSTLVIDTADWAEKLCIEDVCAKNKKKSIEDFSYGKGYTFVGEEFGRLLNRLNDYIAAGVNVTVTAHSKLRKFEQPDEMGTYDRWELKLSKLVAPMLKEWADMVLFCNYKTFVVSPGEGKKSKAQGGARVMYTTHHPCWDAKNRFGLPDEIIMDFSEIAHIFPDKAPMTETAKDKPPVKETNAKDAAEELPFTLDENIEGGDISGEEPAAEEVKAPLSSRLPGALTDLMNKNGVSERELQKAVSIKGYYPEDTPVENYDSDFINGVLVGAWAQVFKLICEIRKPPFEG